MKHSGVRTCVIFNPTAKGDKARRFRQHLDAISQEAELKLTAGPGDARRLAAQAVAEGFATVVAAGGDGTVNEVLNGLGDAPEGFARVRLGVLPLGTINVFARELLIPRELDRAWQCIREGREAMVDLPRVCFSRDGQSQTRYFAQLAGAGLDARAIELVDWRLKKRFGPLAYVFAGFRAITEAAAPIRIQGEGFEGVGEILLIGNGRLYGGDFRIFPQAELRDGVLDICLFRRSGLLALARCGPGLLLGGALPESQVSRYRARCFQVTSERPVSFEVDGEWCGGLPAAFEVLPEALRVVTP